MNTEATTSLGQCINIFITLYHTLYWLIIETWSISLSSQTFLILGIVDGSSSVTLLYLLFRIFVYNHNIYFIAPVYGHSLLTGLLHTPVKYSLQQLLNQLILEFYSSSDSCSITFWNHISFILDRKIKLQDPLNNSISLELQQRSGHSSSFCPRYKV